MGAKPISKPASTGL